MNKNYQLAGIFGTFSWSDELLELGNDICLLLPCRKWYLTHLQWGFSVLTILTSLISKQSKNRISLSGFYWNHEMVAFGVRINELRFKCVFCRWISDSRDEYTKDWTILNCARACPKGLNPSTTLSSFSWPIKWSGKENHSYVGGGLNAVGKYWHLCLFNE